LIKRRRSPKIFFGWWTVLASGFIALWGWGYTTRGMTALFKPIASALGVSRAAVSVPLSIAKLEGSFQAPLTGWLTDKFGPRWVILAGTFLIGLGLILMYYIQSLWAYYVVWGVIIGTGYNISLGVPLDKAIANWFVKKRGLAIGTKWTFSGLSPVLVLPLIAWFITIHGWRMTYVIGGMVMWLVGLPLAWFLIKRERPEYYGLLPDGATTEAELAEDTSQMIGKGVEYAAQVQEVEFTLRQAMRTPAYWLLIVAHAAPSMVPGALAVHFVPFLTDMGINPLRAAMIIAAANAFGLPARFASGFIADRIRRNRLRFLLGGTFLLQALGFTVFLLNPIMAMIYAWFIIYYVAQGASLPLNSVVRARYFGRKAFGSIGGSSMMFLAPVGVMAPIYAGWVYDTTGSYIGAFTLVAVLLAIAGVLAFFTPPPKPPARVTGVQKFL
jgi:sugar phosphate permease